MATKVMLAVTRTGGHVIPGLAIADALRESAGDVEIHFAGAEQGLERRMVPQAGYPLSTVPAIGLSRSLHLDLLRFPWRLFRGILRSLKLLLRYKPHLVICTGGYVSGPIGLCARIVGCPLVLHESNRRAGLTTRILSRFSRQVYLGFPSTAREVGGQERRVVGNHFRQGWRRIDPGEARGRFDLDPDRFTLLVMCGSQGSVAINGVVSSAVQRTVSTGVQVLWQTGEAGYESATDSAKAVGTSARAMPFIEDMEGAYSAASLALTRSGAMTVAELVAMGVPALLIPLPGAVDQRANARAMERSGAALALPQSQLDGDVLLEKVAALLKEPERLSAMAAAARQQDRPPAGPNMARGIRAAGLLRDG